MSKSLDFGKIGGPVYVGRANGERAREKLSVDELDKVPEVVQVEVPDETYSINSSYFLGLFGESIVSFGSTEKFFEHYVFRARETLMETIRRHAERALREQGELRLA